jgi:pimeloyl-ACP methyl ester carboxylesterase
VATVETTHTEKLAVVIPGMQFGPQVSLLAYASRAAANRGTRVTPITWQPPTNLTSTELGPWVVDEVTRVLDQLATVHSGQNPLLIGKSLGSYAAQIAADRGLTAIWFTPLLTHAPVVHALGRASAPLLLVGGTADPVWDSAAAARLSPHVVEIDQADHALWVPGPLSASAAVLGAVATAVEHFLDHVVG